MDDISKTEGPPRSYQVEVRRRSWTILVPIAFVVAQASVLSGAEPVADPGRLVQTLWLFQWYGTDESLDPARDERVKARLAKALGTEGALTPEEMGGLMDRDTFLRLAGNDQRLDATEVARALESSIPATRKRMLPEPSAHLDYLATTFDQIPQSRREPIARLASWIAEHYEPGQNLGIICVCTGNSRRSIFGCTMGNLAADYVGMPEVRFHSGGTEASAFNPRTIRSLRAIGVAIEPTGAEAPRGDTGAANPIHRIRWGAGDLADAPTAETLEFSKRFDDASNPRSGFAALMVCGEADEACPLVPGASVRISLPFLDPKIYDGSAYEVAKYAERRDDIGRTLLAALLQARRSLERAGKLR